MRGHSHSAHYREDGVVLSIFIFLKLRAELKGRGKETGWPFLYEWSLRLHQIKMKMVMICVKLTYYTLT